MFQSLSKLDIFGQRMDTDIALAFAVRAVAVDGDALFFALGLLFVQRWRELHGPSDGAAMAVHVVGCVDAVGLCPGHFEAWWECFILL